MKFNHSTLLEYFKLQVIMSHIELKEFLFELQLYFFYALINKKSLTMLDQENWLLIQWVLVCQTNVLNLDTREAPETVLNNYVLVVCKNDSELPLEQLHFAKEFLNASC